MIPSVEQLERWSVQRADGLTTIPSSAWDGVMWFLRCLELMESDPDAQKAFKRAADQLGGRVTKETQT